MSAFTESEPAWDDDRLARIRAMVLRRLGQTGFFYRDPEDLAQDVMVILLSHMPRSRIDDLENFALGIAKKVLVSALRDSNRSRLVRDREMILAEVTEGDAAMVERHRESAREEIAECLVRHTELDAQAVEFAMLVFVDGLTVKEAGKRMSLSGGKARRLRERIRREFSEKTVNSSGLRTLFSWRGSRGLRNRLLLPRSFHGAFGIHRPQSSRCRLRGRGSRSSHHPRSSWCDMPAVWQHDLQSDSGNFGAGRVLQRLVQ